jgi:transcriptional regulator with XRE-family HTH domain
VFHTIPPMPPRARPQNINYRRNFIRAWRELRGLSQDTLVERVREYLPSFAKSTLSRLENAISPYDQATLEALSMSLGTQPQALLDWDPQSPRGRIQEALDRLSEADLDRVEKIVEAFRTAS